MRLRIALLSLLTLSLAVVPAMAQVVYDNGPINGNTDAWTINFGFIVSDTFTLTSGETVNGVAFGAWLTPGDVLQTAEVSITSFEFGGTTFFDGVVSFSQSGCTTNGFGFNVCTETGDFANVNLAAGTYWLNLQNAVVNTGDPIYWDENSGASSASQNSVGTIPSEAFTVYGGRGCSERAGANSPPCGPPTTPEPSSILLFGSGILGLAGMLRRKLF